MTHFASLGMPLNAPGTLFQTRYRPKPVYTNTLAISLPKIPAGFEVQFCGLWPRLNGGSVGESRARDLCVGRLRGESWSTSVSWSGRDRGAIS